MPPASGILDAPVTLREVVSLTTFSTLALAVIWAFFTGKVRPTSTVNEEKAETKRQYEARLAEKDALIERAMTGWQSQTAATEKAADVMKQAVDVLNARVGRGRA